ncbi:hypothetical protein AMR41_03635 [Hapalosiphon sp. MRB220]|nr:hypothetical protein AMR41_03635 [Hapalosiphon sp. MRB220]
MAISKGVRWGLAGYGDLSRNRLVNALNTKQSCLEVIWGRQLLKAQAFAEEYKIARATDNLETLMTDVDAIYVATPVISHVPLVEMALSKNLHVIVEKPLSPLLHPSTHLPQITAAKDVKVAVAYYRRLMPAAQYVKSLLSSQALGRLHRVVVEFRSLFAPTASDAKKWRCDPAVAGAGVIADVGSHRLDLLCWFFGKPKMLKAYLKDFFPEGCERVAQVELCWHHDISADCHFSWNDHTSIDFMQFHFEHGQLLWSPLDAGYLRFCGEQQTWEKHLPPVANPHAALVSAFCEELPCCFVSEAILVDQIIEAAVESHRTGGDWINLGEDCTN